MNPISSPPHEFDFLGILDRQPQMTASSVPDISMFDPLYSSDVNSFFENVSKPVQSVPRKKARSIEVEIKPSVVNKDMPDIFEGNQANSTNSSPDIISIAGNEFANPELQQQQQSKSISKSISCDDISKKCTIECSVSPLTENEPCTRKKNSIVAGRFIISKDGHNESSNFTVLPPPVSSKFEVDVEVSQSLTSNQGESDIFDNSNSGQKQSHGRDLEKIYAELLSF